MESYTRKCKGDATIRLFKAITISITLIICFIITHLYLHLHLHLHHTNTASISEPNRFDSSLQSSSPYTVFMVSLVRATEQLQDAISLVLSNVGDEAAWRNCSGSVLNGWGEIQDVAEHVIMNPLMSDEMTGQIAAAEGFIDSCLHDLETVESRTAADQVRDKLLLAKVHLRGRGDFLVSYYEQVWDGVVGAAWGVISESFFYIFLCGLQLFIVLWILQKLSKFRST